MIITRTPYRVSFFGGGTDLPAWFQDHGGAVLTSSIAHYCYIALRPTPAYHDTKYRVSWAKAEAADRVEDIQHPAVRAALQYVGVDTGMEIVHLGDLPARSGLGSSSAFSVGMLHALYAQLGYAIINSKPALASAAVDLEQRFMRENVGLQDQIECAHGGLNVIRFAQSGDWSVEPVEVSPERLHALEARLMLFYTGLQRASSEIQAEQVAAMQRNTEALIHIQDSVDSALQILYKGNLNEFGELLDYGWGLKRHLSTSITNTAIDGLYSKARAAGAIGGKVLGAGGGGFLLLYVDLERQGAVRAALSALLEVPFAFERQGSQLILA